MAIARPRLRRLPGDGNPSRPCGSTAATVPGKVQRGMLLVDATRRRVTQLPLLAGTLAAILAIALAVSSRKAADRTVALIALAVLGVYAITEMRRVSRDDDTISVRSLLLAARFPAAGCRVLVRQRGLWNATRIDIELRPPRGWPVKLASYPPLGQGRPRHAAERVAEALGVQGPDLPSTR